jgi:succinoglycan biosynthesis transport protein ExoP
MRENTHSITKRAHSEFALDVPSALKERVVRDSQLTASSLWRTVLKRKYTVFGFAAIVFALAAAYAYSRTPVYEGVARLQIDPSRSTNLGLDNGDKSTSGSPDADSRVKTEVAIIQSDTVATRVINSLGLSADQNFAGAKLAKLGIRDMSQLSPSQRQGLLTTFHNAMKVKVIPSTELVEIRFRNADPALATNAANSIIDEYMKRNFLARVDGTAQVSQWLSKQLEEILQSTTAAQQKLAAFQKNNNLLGTNESDNIVTDRLKKLNEELTQAEADRIVKEGRYRLALSADPELVGSAIPDTRMQTLRTQEAELQAQYSQLSAKFGSNYPKLHELETQKAQLEAQIDAEGKNIGMRLGNEYNAAAKAEAMIRSDFEKQKQFAYKLNTNVGEYAALKHEVEAGQQLYDTLQLKLKEAGITSGLTSTFVNVIDRAQIPDLPVEPRKSLYLALGLGSGLCGGLLLALIRDSFDDTVRSSEQCEALTGIPELACIPFLASLGKKQRIEQRRARPLLSSRSAFSPLALREPNSPGVEAYRALCSVILLAAKENPPKVMVVTSATPGEGKSTVSCNLATALAQRKKNVLLVDADMRCSSIYSPSGARPGLSTMCASGPDAYHPRYQPIATLPNLHVVPAGIRPTDPTGVLDSAQMQELLAAWSRQYDHIVIDTPPILPFSDAMVLAARADGVILVARSGVSRTGALLRARDVLVRSGANLLGFVFNAVKEPEYYYAYPAGYEQVLNRDQESPIG